MKFWIFRWDYPMMRVFPPYHWEWCGNESYIIEKEVMRFTRLYGVIIGNSFFGFMKGD